MGSKMSTTSRGGESEQNSEIKVKLQRHMQENGLEGIEEIFKEELEKWKKTRIKFGVTGGSGAGKSSFINAMRSLPDDDPKSAGVGVNECTKTPTCFTDPSNENALFWDLPGIGSPVYPNLKTYCKMVKLETYDTFVIISASRFTKNDLDLAKKMKSMKKKFFFVRTKIDDNVRSEKKKKKKNFDENAMLESIRRNCIENLDDLVDNVEDIYLISNHYPEKWDFARLIRAILKVLPTHKRESLTLTLKSLSDDILQSKIQILETRLWALAAVTAVIPSISIDLGFLISETKFYRSQVGLPEEDSEQFSKLSDVSKAAIRKLCLITPSISTHSKLLSLVEAFDSESKIDPEKVALFIFLFDWADQMTFAEVFLFFLDYLGKVKETAKSVLDEIAHTTSQQAFDLD